MFSGLPTGTALYVLDKSEKPKLITGYVERVSAPHPMYLKYNPAVSFGANLQTVVDVVIRMGNETKEFVGIPSVSTVHAYGDYVLSESRDDMIREVTTMLLNSKSIIASIAQHESNVEACEDILKELNPVYAKESERDETIDNIANRMNRMEDILARLESRLNISVQ